LGGFTCNQRSGIFQGPTANKKAQSHSRTTNNSDTICQKKTPKLHHFILFSLSLSLSLSLSQQLKPTDHVPLLPFFGSTSKKTVGSQTLDRKIPSYGVFKASNCQRISPESPNPIIPPKKVPSALKHHGDMATSPGSSQFPLHWATRRVSMSSTALRITGKLLITPPTNLGKRGEATKKSGCHGRTTRYHDFRT